MEMLAAALQYLREGLCVIPVRNRDKAPALETWEQYQNRQSTEEEVMEWFGNGRGFNIGIVHGTVSGNYIATDIDHDAGLFDMLRREFPMLFTGRLEQSGSGEGYHIPLRVERMPDFGTSTRQDRPRGNRTWKTEHGDCNVRARYCQTVAPPSVHPSGNRYRFIQEGPIVQVPNLDALIAWLNELAPPPPPRPAPRHRARTTTGTGNTLVEAVRMAWPEAMDVFKHFGIVGPTKQERDGETRILGHGGLLIAQDDPATWYCFSDEMGGGVIEAWGWCRYGSAFDKPRHFRQVLLEMAQAAGIDAARFYRRGDEKALVAEEGNRNHWGARYNERWRMMR